MPRSLRSKNVYVAIIVLAMVLAADAFSKTSPFEDIKFVGSHIEVLISNKWFALDAANGVNSSRLVRESQRLYRDKWAKRIAEDLPDLFRAMQKPFSSPVSIEATSVDSKESRHFLLRSTEENRARIKLRYTNERRYPELPAPILTIREANHDLDTFEHSLRGFSYAKLRGFDYSAALRGIRGRLPPTVEQRWLALELAKIIYRSGDGHGRLRQLRKFMGGKSLPLYFRNVGDRIVALTPKGDLPHPNYPWVTAIDGVPIAKWLSTVGTFVADGSLQLKRVRSLGLLNQVGFIRELLKHKPSNSASLTFQSREGKRIRTNINLTWNAPRQRQPRFEWLLLDEDLGYLRIPSMDGDADRIAWIHQAMSQLRRSKGLIIDVRGNGGGNRKILRALFPYFMSQNDQPHIANVSAYHRAAPRGKDKMAGRFLFPASHFKGSAKKTVENFRKRFKPEWTLPESEFSEWHYLVMQPTLSEKQYRYKHPVVLLIDSDCFSATDIFAGAFKGRPNITLVGTPTSGGSGSSTAYELPNSKIPYRLSTMASFQPNGKLYDGNGIHPDLPAEPTLSDILGKNDSALERARDLLLLKKGNP